jgi:hypothetical protein
MKQGPPLLVPDTQSDFYQGEPRAGTPEIALDKLSELYQDLERQHLVPLWEDRLTAPAT